VRPKVFCRIQIHNSSFVELRLDDTVAITRQIEFSDVALRMHIADGRRMRRWHSRSMENSKWSPHNNCAIKITLNNEPSSRCQLCNTPMNYNYFVRAMERMVTLNRRSETSQEIILENYWNKTFGLTLSVDLEFTNCH